MINILLVDDDESYLELVKRFFIKAAPLLDVRCASNGYIALSELSNSQFDLMITDLNMPGLDGIQLATTAKTVFPDISIVMTTGYLSSEVHLAAMQAGIAKVILKPLEVTQLSEIIKDILSGSF